METGLGNLCGKENKTVKTGQDGVAIYKYGRKRAGGHSGTPAKPSVGGILLLLRKRHSQPWNSQASAQQEGALSWSSHPDKTLSGLRPLLGFFLASPFKSDEVLERALKKLQRRQIKMIKGLGGRTEGAAEASLVEMRAGGEPSDFSARRNVYWGQDQTLPPSLSSAPGQGSASLDAQETVFGYWWCKFQMPSGSVGGTIVKKKNKKKNNFVALNITEPGILS